MLNFAKMHEMVRLQPQPSLSFKILLMMQMKDQKSWFLQSLQQKLSNHLHKLRFQPSPINYHRPRQQKRLSPVLANNVLQSSLH